MNIKDLIPEELVDYLYQEAEHYEEGGVDDCVKLHPQNLRDIADKIEKLNDINYELLQNLVAAENQNHYLVLMRKYKDENFMLKKQNEKYREALEDLVEATEYGENQWQAAFSPDKETKGQKSIKKAKEVLKDD